MRAAAERFSNQTSLHGAYYVGYARGGIGARSVWLAIMIAALTLMSILLSSTMSAYLRNETSISTIDLGMPLNTVHFPSLVVCNISPFRRSFVKMLTKKTQELIPDITSWDIYKLVDYEFITGGSKDIPKEEQMRQDKILNTILRSKFFEEYFRNFMNISIQEEVQGLSNGRMFLWSSIRDPIDDGFVYNNDTKVMFHKNLFRVLAAQWQPGELIPFIQWNGFDSLEANNEMAVMQELGFGTDYGVCTWVTPYFKNPDPDKLTELKYLKLGALNGDNNGISLLLDAETYDNAVIEDILGSRVGQGFKVSVVHNLDIPLVRQSGLHVSVGTNVQLGVEVTQHRTTDNALRTFLPVDRKCWNSTEINFEHLRYDYDYRYNMNNCLYEASLQKSEKECGCLPGFQSFTESPCDGKGLKCHQDIIYNTGLYRNITDPVDGKIKDCMPACFNQNFNMLISDTRYPGMNTIKFRQDFCYVVNKLKVSCNNEYKRVYIDEEYGSLCIGVEVADREQACDKHLHWHTERFERNKTRSQRYSFENDVVDYMSKNIAILNLFINKPSVKNVQTDVAVTLEELIANLGGILGLSIGASAITLVEILWHILLYLITKINHMLRTPRKLSYSIK